MLYLKKKISDTTYLGIWKVEEPIDHFLSDLEHKEWLEAIDASQSENRKRVMLATRLLLKELVGEEMQICYLPSGKPYLSDGSWNVSISHTKDYVAVIVDKVKSLGLDIEQRTDKVFRVRERFLADDDYIDGTDELSHLLLHWSAKEAMFKYLDPPSIDFREHLHVIPFIPKESGIFEIWESITCEQEKFEANYISIPEFILVYITK